MPTTAGTKHRVALHSIQRFTVSAAVAVVLTTSLTGCGVISGIFGGSAPATPTESAAPPDALATDQEPVETGGPDEPMPGGPQLDPVIQPEPEEPSAEIELNAGTIELSLEEGGAERIFDYTASHCYVSDDYMLVEATGVERGTGKPSTVNIFAEPLELLHEKTGTYQAAGLIKFTDGYREVVSDGRDITVEGHVIPSGFTYRASEAQAHFVVAWFVGPATTRSGAGYVLVNCNY
ncbi:hypothetical protein V5R04_11955 [Jonesiaceae bacterium BS-20]|uniref:Lipoprotein n=1 Tax=Jonesiaceae bacterium BS-20 TaxID=3120821 RepID=A0AAU7DW04_9MICO